jgi:diguanylate cyclase (GGDEF)-like protein
VEILLLSLKGRPDHGYDNGLSHVANLALAVRRSKPNAHVSLWAAAIVLLLAGQLTASLLVPRGFLLTLATDVIALLLMCSAVFVFLANARATIAQTRVFWTLAASSWGITLVGQALWMYFDVVLRREAPNPFVGDVLLFLSNVPFLAALLLQPNLDRPGGAKQKKSLDFVLLLLWWLYLYLFYVIPWQYISPNEARYGSNYNFLSALMDVVLLSTIAFSWWHSSGGWRWIFASFFAAQLLNGLTAYWSNKAIERHLYFPGSWYDVPYAVALASFTMVGLVGLAAKSTSLVPTKPRAELPFAGLGMASVLSIPVLGAWAALHREASPDVALFRQLATLSTVSVMALLVFAKKQQLAAQLTQANQVLQEASTTDFLTGVRNRRFFDLIISGEVSQILRSRTSPSRLPAGDLVLYMMDLDDFKEINDEYGHEMGDRILIEVAQRIRALIRSSDVLIRWGGDEFLIVSPDSTRAGAAGFALRILNAFAKPIETDSVPISLNISIGWAAFPWFPEDPDRVPVEAVLGLADRALYEAKEGGKNRVVGPGPRTDGKSFDVAAGSNPVPAYSVETICQPRPPQMRASGKAVML